jgi:hypothetical protein
MSRISCDIHTSIALIGHKVVRESRHAQQVKKGKPVECAIRPRVGPVHLLAIVSSIRRDTEKDSKRGT